MSVLSIQKDAIVNHSRSFLKEKAVQHGEGVVSTNGALQVTTGKRTGRSPKDRFLVCDAMTQDTVNWGVVNQPMDAALFESLWQKASDTLGDKDAHVSHLKVGADDRYGLTVKVVTEKAWHSLVALNLFIESKEPLAESETDWQILNVPSFVPHPDVDGTDSDGVVAIHMAKRRVLLCGMHYAGEMKKAMFTALNYILPEKGVLPMHCAANQGENGDVALFFGLSGTGKTTLSADPERCLIGDDEHGWTDDSVFNFEGGCYAKCINLSQEDEPVIWSAIRDGAVMENVVLSADGHPDYADDSLTANTRVAYPISYIENHVPTGAGALPQAVVFLACDMYGVLPAVSVLSNEQAAYYFLSGYTALVGSTEFGSAAGIRPVFSACFGAPFFPREPGVYAELLLKKLEATGATAYLVNTGWTGGAYGEGGHRFSIPVTRHVVRSVLNGTASSAEQGVLDGFGLSYPKTLPSLEHMAINPAAQWSDQQAFEQKKQQLMQEFRANMETLKGVSSAIQQAGPQDIA